MGIKLLYTSIPNNERIAAIKRKTIIHKKRYAQKLKQYFRHSF